MVEHTGSYSWSRTVLVSVEAPARPFGAPYPGAYAPPAPPPPPEYEPVRDDAELPGAGTRDRLMSLIRADPGVHKSDLCRMTGLSWGSISHHLQVLGRHRRIQLHMAGKRTMVFPAEVRQELWSALSALRDPRAAATVDHLKAVGRASLKEMAAHLGTDAKTTRRILQRLEEVAIVHKQGYTRPRFLLSEDRMAAVMHDGAPAPAPGPVPG